MFLPNKMTKVNVVVFSKYLGALTEALGNSGLLHLVDAASESRGKLLTSYDTGVDIRAIEKLLNRCRMKSRTSSARWTVATARSPTA